MAHTDSMFDRRGMLKRGLAAGAAFGVSDLGFLSQLPPVSAREAQVDPKTVQLESGIEPIVRLIEETPRDSLLGEVASRLKKGRLSYRELLAGLLLAGVRNIEPRPSVGYKFHAVLVVNSAHLASLASPAEHRWLPIFWTLDYFKRAAASDRENGDWTMAPVEEPAVPKATKAREAFIKAMTQWDEPAADAAVAGFSRAAGSNEMFDVFCRLGARDYRSIGHKAIFVSNGFRTMQTIGWQYSEPVLRSLAYALLMHEGDNPAGRDARADRAYRKNCERIKNVRKDWQNGKLDDGATRQLLQALRSGDSDETSSLCVELLNQGVSPQSLWDAILVGAGELLIREPGIISLHAVTTSNALRYAFKTAGDQESRLIVLLQNAAFLPLFRESMHGRGKVKEVSIETLNGIEKAPESPEAIFEKVNEDPLAAARAAKAYLDQANDPRAADRLMHTARTLIYLKSTNAHDYKFSSAVLEDYHHVSPNWRNAYLASSLFLLRGAGEKTNEIVGRTRAAFG